MGENKGHTTVAVDSTTLNKLDRLAKASGVTKKEFIAISMDYFLKNGIDPVTCETPTQELVKLNKRIDDLFRFLKHQETVTIVPMAGGSLKNHAVTQNKIDETKTAIDEIKTAIDKVINPSLYYTFKATTYKAGTCIKEGKSIKDEINDLNGELTKRDEQFSTLLDAYKGLLAYIDPKDKSKLSQVLNKLSNL